MYPNLKFQLWRSGTRQNRLAKMLQMDETVLSKIINGFREPSSELRARVAELLHCDADWLFEPTPPDRVWEGREGQGRQASGISRRTTGLDTQR